MAIPTLFFFFRWKIFDPIISDVFVYARKPPPPFLLLLLLLFSRVTCYSRDPQNHKRSLPRDYARAHARKHARTHPPTYTQTRLFITILWASQNLLTVCLFFPAWPAKQDKLIHFARTFIIFINVYHLHHLINKRSFNLLRVLDRLSSWSWKLIKAQQHPFVTIKPTADKFLFLQHRLLSKTKRPEVVYSELSKFMFYFTESRPHRGYRRIKTPLPFKQDMGCIILVSCHEFLWTLQSDI